MANYVLLERIELNASAASVTFNNIPQSGYTDLKVAFSLRSDFPSDPHDYFVDGIRFNGTTSTYSTKMLYGTGSAAASGSDSSTGLRQSYYNAGASTSNTFANGEMYIPNYNSTSTYKSVSIDQVTENNATSAIAAMTAGLWSSNSAITQITFYPRSGYNFVQYSTFSLYGLAASGTTPTSAPKASGGNIQTDGTYWYHTFLSSGTFTPATSLTCEALVVAGGGSGGYDRGSGGGAGGLSFHSAKSVIASTYTVTIGAGGGTQTGYSQNNPGTNSVFDTITSDGGAAGNVGNGAGRNGGSGSGSAQNATAGTATQGNTGGATGYGNNGGVGTQAIGSNGGGGGAGAVGGAGTSGQSGAGGAGLNTWSSWASATGTGASGYYAGGGGGGACMDGATAARGLGGAGGGGAGGSGGGGAGTAGTINTGGAGGGGSNSSQGNGGAGGSGIVIIRYAM